MISKERVEGWVSLFYIAGTKDILIDCRKMSVIRVVWDTFFMTVGYEHYASTNKVFQWKEKLTFREIYASENYSDSDPEIDEYFNEMQEAYTKYENTALENWEAFLEERKKVNEEVDNEPEVSPLTENKKQTDIQKALLEESKKQTEEMKKLTEIQKQTKDMLEQKIKPNTDLRERAAAFKQLKNKYPKIMECRAEFWFLYCRPKGEGWKSVYEAEHGRRCDLTGDDLESERNNYEKSIRAFRQTEYNEFKKQKKER